MKASRLPTSLKKSPIQKNNRLEVDTIRVHFFYVTDRYGIKPLDLIQ